MLTSTVAVVDSVVSVISTVYRRLPTGCFFWWICPWLFLTRCKQTVEDHTANMDHRSDKKHLLPFFSCLQQENTVCRKIYNSALPLSRKYGGIRDQHILGQGKELRFRYI